MSDRQTTICAGDVVQDGDGVQWQVQAVSRTSLGWLCGLSLTRSEPDGRSVTRTADPAEVTLVGQQLTLGGEP